MKQNANLLLHHKCIIVTTFLFMQQIFPNYGDIHENKIVNFPQLQCLVGTSRSNLVNFVKTESLSFAILQICEILVL